MPSSSTTCSSRLPWHFLTCILIGVTITAVTTFSLVRHVQYLIQNAEVSESPDFWIQAARVKAYGACYDGCHDCIDVEFAEKACRITTKVNVTGVICDANKMWNWAERYPIECLSAVGDIYKADALWRLKWKYRAQLLLVVFTVPAGILGYFATDGLLQWIVANWCTATRIKPIIPRRRSPHRRIKRSGSSTALLGSAAIASMAGTAHAYPCTTYNPAHNQFFASPDHKLYGVVHGWLSNCYTYTYSCGEACPSNYNGGSRNGCRTVYCEGTDTSATPIDYVLAASKRVSACGFELVDSVPGVIGARIANPRIERDLWVKVSVNRFNLTDHTEPSIMCLYNMVQPTGVVEHHESFYSFLMPHKWKF